LITPFEYLFEKLTKRQFWIHFGDHLQEFLFVAFFGGVGFQREGNARKQDAILATSLFLMKE